MLPLSGKHILITRPYEADGAQPELPGEASLEDRLQALGARVSWVPMVRVQPVPFDLQDIDAVDWMWFTSRNGVRAFFDSGQAVRMDPSVPTAAVGPATARILAEYGRPPRFVSPVFDGESAARAFIDQHARDGLRLLWPCGNRAGQLPAKLLQEAGMTVLPKVVYETSIRQDFEAEETAVLQTGGFDVVVFTSPSGVTGFQAWLQRSAPADAHFLAACLGPSTARAACEAFNQTPIQPVTATMADLAQAIATHG